jgi:hypothetical protein
LEFSFLSSKNMSRTPATHFLSSPQALAIRIDGNAAADRLAGGLQNVVASR